MGNFFVVESALMKNNIGFVIYGTGPIGRKFYCTLKKYGRNIEAFLDQAAKKGELLDGIPVLTKEDFFKDVDLNHQLQYIVLVSLRNGNAHMEIVHTFLQAGFEKIIYLPMPNDIWHDGKEKEKLRQAYRELAQGVISMQELPSTFLEKEDFSRTGTFIDDKRRNIL